MDRKLTAALVAEAAGTCLFFIVGAGSIVLGTFAPPGPDLLGVALAHGLVLAVLVSSLGAVSGGHFNPAVTFGLWIAGKIEAPRAGMYVVAQLVGAVIAGFVLRFIFPDAWAPSAHRRARARRGRQPGDRHRPRGDHDDRAAPGRVRDGGRPARPTDRRASRSAWRSPRTSSSAGR